MSKPFPNLPSPLETLEKMDRGEVFKFLTRLRISSSEKFELTSKTSFGYKRTRMVSPQASGQMRTVKFNQISLLI